MENNNNNINNGFINRERENIVKATIDANNNINEEQVKTVNNKIKVKKKNYFLIALIVIICLALAVYLTYYGVFKIKNKMDQITSTTTTVTTKENVVLSYLNKDIVKKFKNENSILYILPKSYGIVIKLDISNNELISSNYGTYNIESEGININLNNENELYKITETGIEGSQSYKLDDSEFKYYEYKDEEISEMVLVNGTLGLESIYMVDTNHLINSYVYLEDKESITLGDKVFKKVGDSLVFDNTTYDLKY